jgi:hypothetical protein
VRQQIFHKPDKRELYHQKYHVKWLPCHQGMAHPQVANRDSLQIWRVAANTLNKQSQTAEGGGPAAWRLGGGLTTPNVKIYICC